ncbi:PAAR domain-containing protein [uncultured Desulfovibrio sp.]|uniref:PAAR domain-containing protein n=1 Tax=uncultured Desulfovibrio sp. TaxID=167968 RepID=UPI0025FB6CA9|nr:PAAR domain-containing protein [uncultured Desulfovibrio sp.]
MSGKPVARVGDTGSHGGTIINGSPTVRANNRPIALVGSTYNCPVHGPNPIVTGAPFILDDDVLVAHVGSKTACGAEITSGSPDVFIHINDIEYDKLTSSSHKVSNMTYNGAFQLINDETGQPICNMLYALVVGNKIVAHGKTGKDGFTERIYTQNSENLEIFIGTSAHKILYGGQ